MNNILKRCLLVTCVYPPEPVVSAQTSSQIAEALVDCGVNVTVVTCFPNRPGGKCYPNYSRSFFKKYREKGVEVIRCFSTLSHKSTLISRFMENLSFGLTSGYHVLFSKRPDVIYSNTWPVLATGIIALVALLRRIPMVISVQDIYPESLIAQKRINDKHILSRLMRWIDRAISHHCAHVIVISDGFVEIYLDDRQLPVDRISMIPNWIDRDLIDISEEKNVFRKKKNISANDFLLVYGGNIGVAAGVEKVIDAMRFLDPQVNARFLVAGAGSKLSECMEMLNNDLKDKIIFHSPWLWEETSEVLLSADVLMLPTQGEQSLSSVPSKLLFYMLAGRPVITTAIEGSSLADFVQKSQCGWVVEPDRPDLMAAKIKEIMENNPAELTRCGHNGHEYVLKHFTKEVCLPKILKILKKCSLY